MVKHTQQVFIRTVAMPIDTILHACIAIVSLRGAGVCQMVNTGIYVHARCTCICGQNVKCMSLPISTYYPLHLEPLFHLYILKGRVRVFFCVYCLIVATTYRLQYYMYI